MSRLSVMLRTSLKTNNGVIIPAGKFYVGEITEFPSWLVSEIKGKSNALNIKELETETFIPKEIKRDSEVKLVRRSNRE